MKLVKISDSIAINPQSITQITLSGTDKLITLYVHVDNNFLHEVYAPPGSDKDKFFDMWMGRINDALRSS